MKAKDAKRASALIESLDAIADVRKGLKEEAEDGNMQLELEAMDGDYEGGTGHGTALIPLYIAPRILDYAEKVLKEEILALGVELDE